MSRNQSFRRAHAARVKQRVRWFMRVFWDERSPSGKQVGFWASTGLSPCSCPGCGNPRRHFGHRTRAELEANQTLVEGVRERLPPPDDEGMGAIEHLDDDVVDRLEPLSPLRVPLIVAARLRPGRPRHPVR